MRHLRTSLLMASLPGAAFGALPTAVPLPTAIPAPRDTPFPRPTVLSVVCRQREPAHHAYRGDDPVRAGRS